MSDTVGLATHYEVGRRWLLANAYRMDEEFWLPELEKFCLRACAGDVKRADYLASHIIWGVPPTEH